MIGGAAHYQQIGADGRALLSVSSLAEVREVSSICLYSSLVT